jgi:hypothetical protein
MEEKTQLPIYLKGPAALEKRMIECRTLLRETLRQATRATERNFLQHQIAKVNLVLRDLRKKRRPPLYHELDDLTDRMRVMARLAKSIGRGRDVIYHGTRALPKVMKAGKLVPSIWAEEAVFFTRSAEVAAYFACLQGEKEERRVPGVLVLNRASIRQCYRLEPNRYDPFRGYNEREEAIWGRIVNFRRHLIGIVSDANVSEILGIPKRRYLPHGFARWPAAKRRKHSARDVAAGDKSVRPGRVKVRALIITEREARNGGSPGEIRKPRAGRA